MARISVFYYQISMCEYIYAGCTRQKNNTQVVLSAITCIQREKLMCINNLCTICQSFKYGEDGFMVALV